MTLDDLRSKVKEYRDNRQLSILCTATGMSKSYISKWLSGTLGSNNTTTFEMKLRAHFGTKDISFADKQRVKRIRAILNESDDPESIVSELARTLTR